MVTSASTNNYTIHYYKLQWSSCTRDLGIFVDNELKFAQHIYKITHIGHSHAALILKCFFTRDPEVLIKAYCTYVQPILEYCTPCTLVSPSWYNYSNSNSNHTMSMLPPTQRPVAHYNVNVRISNGQRYNTINRVMLLRLGSGKEICFKFAFIRSSIFCSFQFCW